MYAINRLPGISVETVHPPAVDALPRMDVAAFVGFASRGPVHRPVAIDSVAAFAAVFGGDLALVRDGLRAEIVKGALAPAVRGFFSNGGRLCWVIRVARSAALEASWRGVSAGALAAEMTAHVASTGQFIVPGMLAVSGDGSGLTAAVAEAGSLGSWSDHLRVSARIERNNFTFLSQGATATGFRFSAPRGSQDGDLIELSAPDSQTRAYARIVGIADGRADAEWCGAFQDIADALADREGTAQLVGEPLLHKASFGVKGRAHLRFAATVPSGLEPGRWLRCLVDSDEIVLRLETVSESAVTGDAWAVARTPALPPPPVLAARVSVALRVDDGNETSVSGPFALTPDHSESWWRNLGDDAFYAARPTVQASQRSLLAAVERDRLNPPDAWLPLGLDDNWSAALGASKEKRTALERDGLSKFDRELFLDPALAELRTVTLATEADRLRDLGARQLFGIHGTFAIGSGANFNEASMIAVPDAIHPGWDLRKNEEVLQPNPDAVSPAHWFDHRGPCAVVPANVSLAAPDASRFLDCTTRELLRPVFVPFGGPQPTGQIVLSWTASEPDAIYRLEEAGHADFAGATTVWRGAETTHTVHAGREGIYYYRVSAELGGEVSEASTIAVLVRDSVWIGRRPEDFVKGSEAELLAIHRAVLRLCASSGELFAVLCLPRDFGAREAIAYVSQLARWRNGFGDIHAFDTNERRALSYGAVYHPWLASPSGSTTDPKLVTAPPDGTVAGTFATMAIRRGAWIAPANIVIQDIVALSPAIVEGDRLALDTARINLVRRDARGFLVLDADTLSDEREWRQINVRRLMSLLRRTAIRRGSSYLFEPNGDVLQRAIERGFSQMLDDFVRRGAFSGRTSADSYRIMVAPTRADREAGRLIVEIAVAPSQPMRFVTLRLAQQGERFTVAEER